MLLLSTILSMLLGKVRGGTFSNMADVRLCGTPAIFAVLLCRVLLYNNVLSEMKLLAGVLHTSLFLVLVYALWLNRRIAGMKLAALGAILNSIVIAANGGRMPVAENALRQVGTWDTAGALLISEQVGTHILVTYGTRLAFLGDVLWLRWPWGGGTAFSAGDVVLVAGVFIAVQHMMGAARRSTTNASC